MHDRWQPAENAVSGDDGHYKEMDRQTLGLERDPRSTRSFLFRQDAGLSGWSLTRGISTANMTPRERSPWTRDRSLEIICSICTTSVRLHRIRDAPNTPGKQTGTRTKSVIWWKTFSSSWKTTAVLPPDLPPDMRRKHSIFTLLSVLPVSLFGYFDGFKTDYRHYADLSIKIEVE